MPPSGNVTVYCPKRPKNYWRYTCVYSNEPILMHKIIVSNVNDQFNTLLDWYLERPKSVKLSESGHL